MRIFEARFHGSWPKLSTHTLEKYSKIRIHLLFLLPSSSFGRVNSENPNSKFILHKRRFRKDEQKVQSGFSSFTILHLPNEDFGRMNKRLNADFRSTFQWNMAQIVYSRPLKSASKINFVFGSSFQNLRLGSINFSKHFSKA
jgi:hypothetical protein